MTLAAPISAAGERRGERVVIVLATLALSSDPAPPEGPVLEIHVETSDNHTLCRPVGELDAYTVGQFRESLGELSEATHLLIDLSEVPFMDSAGLGALIGGIRRTREAGGDVAVACSRPTLTRLLHTTGFDRIVAVTETVEDAAEALAKGEGDPAAGADH